MSIKSELLQACFEYVNKRITSYKSEIETIKESIDSNDKGDEDDDSGNGKLFNDLEKNSFNSNHIASSSDAIITFVGISALIEGERGDAVLSNNHGDRKEISLPKNQINFLKEI